MQVVVVLIVAGFDRSSGLQSIMLHFLPTRSLTPTITKDSCRLRSSPAAEDGQPAAESAPPADKGVVDLTAPGTEADGDAETERRSSAASGRGNTRYAAQHEPGAHVQVASRYRARR